MNGDAVRPHSRRVRRPIPIYLALGQAMTIHDSSPDSIRKPVARSLQTGTLRPQDANLAIELAGDLLRDAIRLQTPQERRQQAELDRMIGHEEDKATLVEMTDQAFRTHTPARVADQLTHLLDVQGIPRFFSPVEQAMLRGFQSFGEYLPGVAVPLVKDRMRRETANVILPAEAETLGKHLRLRQDHGVEMNVNLLGEALLGEEETRARIETYLAALTMPELSCLSVKISTLYSQILPIARDRTIDVVADRLEMLYRTATEQNEAGADDGNFVYLDMEEYRDLHLTAEALMAALDRDGMGATRAGIALQAYIPDSYSVMRTLIEWSRRRVSRGARPLTIRLVKGANMEMERVEASINGWPQAPYKTKLETDANYKRMLLELLEAAAERSVRVGIASHNLFDVALALIWGERLGILEENKSGAPVQFEMLEGMANHQRRSISQRNVKMLLYAPACRRAEFLHAIGYLIRRLDENTGPQNFLRYSYRLRVESPEFEMLANHFRDSVAQVKAVSTEPRRQQDRNLQPSQPPAAESWRDFVNEPDTDWSLPHNACWIAGVLEAWKQRCDQAATDVPLRIGEETVAVSERQREASFDPSRPGVVACRFAKATVEQVTSAVELASRDPSGWRTIDVEARHHTLRRAAQELRRRRGDLIAAMLSDGGKTVLEADPEVSEAIDFTEFYPLTAAVWERHPRLRASPRGVVAVIPPWNFPLAIPCGGIAASLAAGNSVVLKPAKATVLPAYLVCQAFWEAGVPRDALQMIPCDNDVAEQGLIRNLDVETVILTGGTATAQRMLSVRPNLHLLAETGGKNATIVTAMADRELAIKHVVQSAFGHSGQKCSATSLLLLEKEVFEDESFRTTLADAVRSLKVGSVWELDTRVGPLIEPASAKLTRGMELLENDESWLVAPEPVAENPQLYRPGVKWNLKPQGYTHRTELFGPILGVMPFSRLEEAIELVRSTGYGLTSGLESLDDREIELWRDAIGAGNLYVNRHTTGAIVLRQPFGGVGLSSYGPGIKAGGPHYVTMLCHFSDRHAPNGDRVSELPANRSLDRFADWLQDALDEKACSNQTAERVSNAVRSQRLAVDQEFAKSHDHFRLVGQDNIRRYRVAKAVTLRVHACDSDADGGNGSMSGSLATAKPSLAELVEDSLITLSAALAVDAQVTLSIDPALPRDLRQLLESTADELPGLIEPVEETPETLCRRIADGAVRRLRVLQPLTHDSEIARVCGEQFTSVLAEPVLSEGCLECLCYLNEQSISHDYHRYGNLGRRAGESRRDVL